MRRAAHKLDVALDAIEEATEPIARWESGCHLPKIQIGTGIKSTVVPYVSKTLAFLENFAACSFQDAEWVLDGVPDPRKSERMTGSNVKQVRTSINANRADVWLFSMWAGGPSSRTGMTCCFREVSD